MRYRLSAKGTLIVRGPSSIRLVSGQAEILGGELPPRQTIVPRHKQLPIETQDNAELEITSGREAQIFEIQGSTIPPSWEEAALTLRELREGNVVVLGATDVGKSTLCVYLVNKLLQKELSTGVIDADIGQADLGPPTTIGRATPSGFITSLPELRTEARLFIGHTSASYVQQKLIAGVQRLMAESEASLKIINTDGWVADKGAVIHKIDFISKISPDLVLALSCKDELSPILVGIHANALTLGAAINVLERSRWDRKVIRTEGYRRFLDGATAHRIPLTTVELSIPKQFPAIRSANANELRNLILGILSQDEHLIQIGILKDIRRNDIIVYSRAVDGIRKIELGYVKLSPAGRENGFL